MNCGIISWGAYVPRARLERKDIAAAWGIPAARGERAVAAGDEDSLTMAVAAGAEALAELGPDNGIDAVYFASTSSPYREKQAAATVVAALDLPENSVSMDVTGSLRAGMSALLAACDAVESGRANRALVVAGDVRLGEPGSSAEQLMGDAAAAVVIGRSEGHSILSTSSRSEEFIGQWRRAEDQFVHRFEPKLELAEGIAKPLAAAVGDALARAGRAPNEVSTAVLPAPDPGSPKRFAKACEIDADKLAPHLLDKVGDSGAAASLLGLVGALDAAQAGDLVVAAATGEGADAIVIEANDTVNISGKLRSALANGERLERYVEYLSSHHVLPTAPDGAASSPVTYWRDRKAILNFHGGKCTACGQVQFPLAPVCFKCHGVKTQEAEPLTRTGEIFTYTLDHLYQNRYLDTPIPRCVVTLDGGGRALFEMVDCDPQDVHIGQKVELALRLMHEGAEFRNYFWKCKPLTAGGADDTAADTNSQEVAA